MLKLFIYVIFWFFSSVLFGQNYPFREYSVLDGLPQSQTIAANQDSRGFIWIGTRNGLSRFDGITFKNYYRKDGLPSNFIPNALEDNNGIIWALSNEGLSKYTGFGFIHFPLVKEMNGWKISYGSTVGNSNTIYLRANRPGTSQNRLIAFNDGVYSDYAAQFPALDTFNVLSLCFNPPADELFLIDNYQILCLWKENRLSVISSKKIDFVFTEQGNVYAMSGDTLYRYSEDRLEIFLPESVAGRSVINNKNNLQNREFDFFDGVNDSKILLPFNAIGYLIDNEGIPWFSSEKNLYRLLSTGFRVFTEKDITASNIWAIAEDRNGHIWFGSLYGALIEFDGINFKERNDFKKLFKGDCGFFKGSRKMSNGDVWFSTYLGVLIWDGDKFSRLKGIPEDTQICYTYEDPIDRSVMLGTEKGLFHLKDGRILYYPEFIDNNLGVIEGVTREENGEYLLSGHKGLVSFNGSESVPVQEDILPDGYTYTIERDNFGGVWVTSEEGLYYRQKEGEHFKHGLPEEINVSANSIYLSDSTIIVGRISDVCVIDLKRFYNNDPDYYAIFDQTDGFTAADCLDNGIIRDRQGKLWILSSTGVVIFEPGKIKRNINPPLLHLTGFDFETDSLTWEPVEKSQFFYGEPDNIKIDRWNNTIRISFIGISTTNPEKVKYRHHLTGFNDKWSLPASEQSVEFNKLPPGRYVFQVFASNGDGVENPEPLSIEFRVTPAFWETAGFFIFSILLLIVFTVIVTFLILRRVHKERQEQEKLNSELFRLQMNSVIKQFEPHFTFNVISSVGSLIMMGEKEMAYDYVVKFSSLLRTVLNEGSLIIKSLSEELDFVTRYCELQKLRFKERFNYSINVEENIDLQREIPKMTIQTFVENAIRHGLEPRKNGGRVDVTVRNIKTGWEIIIKDNGIGREAAMGQNTEGSGHGLKIIEGIFDAISENNIDKSEIVITDLRNEAGIAAGTEVKIFIPHNFRFEFSSRRIKKQS